jgi:hypothetical protein
MNLDAVGTEANEGLAATPAAALSPDQVKRTLGEVPRYRPLTVDGSHRQSDSRRWRKLVGASCPALRQLSSEWLKFQLERVTERPSLVHQPPRQVGGPSVATSWSDFGRELLPGACTRQRNWSGGESPSKTTVMIWRTDVSPQRSHGGESNLTCTRQPYPNVLRLCQAAPRSIP